MQTRWLAVTRRAVMWGFTLAAAGAAMGCGPTFVAMGADVAGGSMKGATQTVAHGGNPSAGDAAGVAIGVGLMVAGYKLTEPDQRQNPNPPIVPSFYNGAQPRPRQ